MLSNLLAKHLDVSVPDRFPGFGYSLAVDSIKGTRPLGRGQLLKFEILLFLRLRTLLATSGRGSLFFALTAAPA